VHSVHRRFQPLLFGIPKEDPVLAHVRAHVVLVVFHILALMAM